MAYVLIPLLILDVAVHLWSRLSFNDIAGNVTKPLLMPLMYSSAFALAGELSIAVERPGMIVAAAALYTLGDVLLMPKDNAAAYISGAISFMAGHAVLAAYLMLHSFSFLYLAIGAIAGAVPFAVYMRKVSARDPEDLWTFALYGSVIWAFFSSAAASLSPSRPLYSLLAIIGVVFYGYSDSRIVYNTVKHRGTSDFEIMWTYIAANFFLCASVLAMNA